MSDAVRASHRWRPVARVLILGVALLRPGGALAGAGTYRNPLPTTIPGGGAVESCGDPSVIYGQENEGAWYMYCSSDYLNDGDFSHNLIPILRSTDPVNWTYVGDLGSRPRYATGTAILWAPEIEYYPETGRYHVYYTVTETTFAGGGRAIGVAWSDNPAGPWTHSALPVIEPHAADCCPGSRRDLLDPEVLRTAAADYIYYGGFFGGVSVRTLSEDGLTSTPIDDGDPSSATQNVAIANKYEGTEVVRRGDLYYLFASATNCCFGPLTGYSVFVGRSTSPTGPFVDRSGVSFNDNEGPLANPMNGRAGGSVVLSMSGNRWVGPGHNTVIQDFDGQWWTMYHAIDMNDPFFAGRAGYTRRPVLMDAIDWVDDWPIVRGGHFVSDTPQPAPAAQPGETTDYSPPAPPMEKPGCLIWGDEFDGSVPPHEWSWVRQPSAGYGVSGGQFHFDTQATDLYLGSNNASVLTRPAPRGSYVVETKVRITVPANGCCFNHRQAGLVIYASDDAYLKLVHVAIWNTRQTEWAKEVPPGLPGYPRYGNSIVGPPGEWTYLRIVVRPRDDGPDEFTAYTKAELPDAVWERGGTWTHELGGENRIGLVSMGGPDYRSDFEYVRVFRLRLSSSDAGDLDCDGDVDLFDFAKWVVCFDTDGPEGCDLMATPDLDGNGQVDLDDYVLFSAGMTGPA